MLRVRAVLDDLIVKRESYHVPPAIVTIWYCRTAVLRTPSSSANLQILVRDSRLVLNYKGQNGVCTTVVMLPDNRSARCMTAVVLLQRARHPLFTCCGAASHRRDPHAAHRHPLVRRRHRHHRRLQLTQSILFQTIRPLSTCA